MIAEAIERNAENHPDDLAVIGPDQQFTFTQFRDAVRHCANRLHADGLGPGDVVGISVADDVANFIATFALLRLGCVQVLLPTRETASVRADLAARVGCRVCLSDAPGEVSGHGADDAADDGLARLAVARGMDDVDRVPHRPDADDLAMFLTSSGTTGRPKIAALTHGNLVGQAGHWIAPPHRIVHLRLSSMEYNNTRKLRLHSVRAASTNVFVAPVGADAIETCHRYGVTFIGLTVPQARELVRRARAEGRSLPEGCRMRIGGSSVSRELRSEVVDHLTPHLGVTYATSEFGSVATARPEHFDIDPASVGMVHDGVELEIVDAAGKPLPSGSRGEIRVRAPDMLGTYHGDPEASAKAFRDGWFYPGDVGRLLPGNLLAIDGRADDMMSMASMNVFPSEIEAVVGRHPDVAECAAFSVRSGSIGDIPMVAIVPVGNAADTDAVLSFAREHLGRRSPRRVLPLDAIPVTAAGKVDRISLRSLFLEGPGGGA